MEVLPTPRWVSLRANQKSLFCASFQGAPDPPPCLFPLTLSSEG